MDSLPSLAGLILCWNEKKKNSLDHCCIEMFLNLSTTIKSSALTKRILDLPARETCLAGKWNTHILATIALSELYITVLGERTTFLLNWCINEMHYTYRISRRQVWHVPLPWLCCKTRLLQDVTLCVHFFSFKETWSDSVDTLHSLACMIICWNEKEKQLWSFQHPNLARVTNHKENAVEKLKHT